jgi:hypothetical protein
MKLEVRRSYGTDLISLPLRPTDLTDTVVVLELNGPPKTDPVILTQGSDSPMILDYASAVTAGRAVKRFNRDGGFHIAKWMGPQDSITWQLLVSQKGAYHVRIRYAASDESKGDRYQINVAGQIVEGVVAATGEGYQYQTFELKTIQLKAGRCVVQVAPSGNLNHNLMFLHSLELVPDGPIMID